MRWVRLVMVAGATALLALHGCGLDVVGVGADGELLESGTIGGDDAQTGASDAATSDVVVATGDAQTDAARTDAQTGADASATCSCALTAPPGFTLVAFAPNRNQPCAGDLQTEDVVTNPTVGAGACSCGTCTVTTMPTCTPPSTWHSMTDTSGSPQCNQTGDTAHPTSGCDEDNGNFGNHSRVPAPPAQGGACASVVAENPSAVTTTGVRICRPNGTTCACDAAVAAPYKTCLAAKGAVDCPASAPNRRLVATAVDLACPDCSCTLTKSCRATVTWFGNDGCTGQLSVTDSDSCKEQPSGGYRSTRYEVEPKASCTAGSNPTGNAKLVTPDTICCP